MCVTVNGLALVAISSLAAPAAAPTGGGLWWAVGPDRGREPAPTAYVQGDPADSLYRAARAALSGRDYRRAAELFAQLESRYPASASAGDALYWQAFARYRLGGEQSLRQALGALQAQRARYPKAATKGDAAALERRIQGELARRGDPDAAAAIAEAAAALAEAQSQIQESAQAAREAARSPAAPVAPRAPRVSRTPQAPRVPRVPRSRCAEDDDDIKVAALNALQQMDAERAAPILRKVLARRDTASVCLRRKAVFLVAQQQTDSTVDVLLQSARGDPDPEVRAQAVFWLSQVGTDQAAVALDSILRVANDPEIQEKAVFALSQQGTESAQKALRAYAARADVPEAARERAIFWLGQSGHEENAAFLRALYAKLTNEELKKKVLFALAQMGSAESGKWLVEIARTPSEGLELRKQALFWAGQSGVPTAELASTYSSVGDRAMREYLLFVLSQRGDRAASDKLVDIAKRDPDGELRKKALFWLGQTHDPRAAEMLQEIIEQ
jgi:HEAT repeat protein